MNGLIFPCGSAASATPIIAPLNLLEWAKRRGFDLDSLIAP